VHRPTIFVLFGFLSDGLIYPIVLGRLNLGGQYIALQIYFIIMKFHPQAYQSLLEGNYPAVAQFYEGAVETEPEILSHYWYLGLAYLVQEQEAEAQATWLLGMAQALETGADNWSEELLDILELEAQRQESLENYALSWLIRGQIREIEPSLVNNVLHLLQLELRLNQFSLENLPEGQLGELLQESPQGSVDSDLLLQFLAQLLLFPSEATLAVAQASLLHLPDSQALIRTVIPIASKMAYQERQFLYAGEILKLCLKLEPDNLALLNNLYCYYSASYNYELADEVVCEFQNYCHTLSLKLYGNYLQLLLGLRRSNWLELEPIVQRHQTLLRELIEEQPEKIEPVVSDSLVMVPNPLVYLQDNPAENHRLQNQISQIFQKSIRSRFNLTGSFHGKASRPQHQRLRIGYIAHTLKRHSIGWLTRWLFHYHDKEAFQIYLYLVNQQEDALTQQWFRPNAHRCYNFPLEPLPIAKQIQEDEIDILVDLDSTTHSITCQVMSLKPAPVQVTYLGFEASGLPAIDYLLADSYVLPDNAQDYYREKIWRLPHTYISVDGFEVGVPTRRREQLGIPPQAVIYLSAQTGWKRHPNTIRWQMKILKAVPNSYFLIQGIAEQSTVQQLFTKIAQEEGVAPERLRFLAPDVEEVYLANLSIADVVLDTYPFNGGTTTLNVLWMGIPLVTRVGEQWASRNGYTLMKNAGLTEGIAWTDEEYIDWGIRLGRDEALREQVTWKLRNSRQTSPLWNARQFTRDVEAAYQQMWLNYFRF
jgi:predicted O-linked N-acetylglucosamine transferase (SPINDLY family)